MLFVLLLLSFDTIQASKDVAWGVTNCTKPESCRGGQKNPRPCESICFANGTCTLNVGVILPDNPYYIVNMAQAIDTLREAEAAAKDQGLISKDAVINFVEFDDKCSQATATIMGLNASVDYCVHLMIGSICDFCTASLGRTSKMLGTHGVPLITPGGFSFEFTRQKNQCEDEMYMVINSGLVDYRSFAEFFVKIFEENGWQKISLMYEKLDQNEVGGLRSCQLLFTSVIEVGIELEKFAYTDGDLLLTGLSYKEYLQNEVGVKYGIVLLCMNHEHTRQVLLEAESLNMMEKGEYVFFNFEMYNEAPDPLKPWFNSSDNDEVNARAQKAYKSLYTFSPLTEARNTETGKTNTMPRGNFYLDGVYDGFLLYSHILNNTIEEEGLNQDLIVKGEVALEKTFGKVFSGRNEEVTMNCNAQRVSAYALTQMNSSGMSQIVYEYYTYNKSIVTIREIQWPTGKVPLDTPICGFDDSLCPTEINVLVVVISIALAIGLVILSTFLYRHYKLEYEIASMTWKVHWDEIVWLQHTKLRGSLYSIESLNRSKRGSQVTLAPSEYEAFSLAGDRQLYTTVGYYKGIRTAIKPLKDTKIVLTRHQLVELKVLKDFSNDHLVKFYGASIDAPNCCILTEYCPRGSLQDILENEEVKLDWLFRLSLMQDIIKGMHYLHNSEIKTHGSLKSSNCVVDSRFVLKITDFGIQFLRMHTRGDSIDENSHSFWQRQLWTSPELLRDNNPPLTGTQKGDVYSFAIIVHEIVTRQGAFYLGEDHEMSTKGEGFSLDGLGVVHEKHLLTKIDLGFDESIRKMSLSMGAKRK
ncbi:hypothetical protein FQR65_LT00429 [Abscondita terminalis]|nr:hypothetical protein FQR65_LT00429 [Abscondita terminalis]